MSRVATSGAWIALATAVLSGVSVFVNSLGVRSVSDPFVFTTAKNLLVALAIGSIVLLPGAGTALTKLSRKQWGGLLLLGLVGGSVPFLLFFYGLSLASAASAAFMHKTLFIWVAVLAVPLLGERLGRIQVIALAVLVIGNIGLLGWPRSWALGEAEAFTLSATLLWAAEAVLARRLLGAIPVNVAAFGRMAFGALAMLVFLGATGRAGTLVSLGIDEWAWVALTALFLFGYVQGYYLALSKAPATLVTSVLVAGSVVTALLQAMLQGKAFGAEQLAGFAVVLLGAALWVAAAQTGRRSGLEVSHAGR